MILRIEKGREGEGERGRGTRWGLYIEGGVQSCGCCVVLCARTAERTAQYNARGQYQVSSIKYHIS